VSTFFFGLTNPQLWAIMPTIVFAVGVVFVMKGSSFLPKVCLPGTEVIIVTAVATLFSMYFNYSGDVVGDIPSLDPDAGMSFFGGAVKIPIEFLDLKELILLMLKLLTNGLIMKLFES
jgi:hypothetical protein